MQISAINKTNNPNFKAKFLDTPAVREVAAWAVKNNKFDELNKARKQIDYAAVKVRIHMDLGSNIEGCPIAIFRRYFPRIQNPVYEEDFLISKPIVYQSREKINPIEYGYKKIIQMGHYVTRNRLFKEIVVDPPQKTDIDI